MRYFNRIYDVCRVSAFACTWTMVFLTLCLIVPVGTARADGHKPTFSNDVAKIIFSRCAGCHQPNQSAPFSLLNYQQVVEHSETILAVLESNYMPPWKPTDHGIAFSNNRQLTENEKKTIADWVRADCPVGDEKAIPTPPIAFDGWALGKPDLIVKLDRPFPVPADGPDIYRSFAFPVSLPEDRWIKAIELRPTSRGVVHHALFFVDADGNAKSQKSRDGLPGFIGMNFLRGGKTSSLTRLSDSFSRGLGGYVPGAVPNLLPGDLARFLPRGSDIVMQTHFHPNGKAEHEQSELGIYFASQPPKQKLVTLQLPPLFGMGAGIDIPAGQREFRIHDSYTLPIAIRGVEIGGHAHYLCTQMSMKAKLPDGSERVLLEIADWDLDWQDQYIFKEPIDLPAGTNIEVDVVYDNSSDNPENPFSPPRRVQWGRESTDEMGAVTLLAIASDESERDTLERDIKDKVRSGLANRIRSQMKLLGGINGQELLGDKTFKLLDRDNSGKIDSEEIPARARDRIIDLLDDNGDESISREEMNRGRDSIQNFLNEDDDLRNRLRQRLQQRNNRPISTNVEPVAAQSTTAIAFSQNESHNATATPPQKNTVLIFTRSNCPIANGYQPKLKQLREEFPDDKWSWTLVYSQPGITESEMKDHAKEYDLSIKQVADSDLSMARKFQAKVTPQAIVLSPTGDVLYSGRIDNLYESYGKKRAVVTQEDLQTAMHQIDRRESVTINETSAIGCVIRFPGEPTTNR